jgi:translation initiation factor IF-2
MSTKNQQSPIIVWWSDTFDDFLWEMGFSMPQTPTNSQKEVKKPDFEDEKEVEVDSAQWVDDMIRVKTWFDVEQEVKGSMDAVVLRSTRPTPVQPTSKTNFQKSANTSAQRGNISFAWWKQPEWQRQTKSYNTQAQETAKPITPTTPYKSTWAKTTNTGTKPAKNPITSWYTSTNYQTSTYQWNGYQWNNANATRKPAWSWTYQTSTYQWNGYQWNNANGARKPWQGGWWKWYGTGSWWKSYWNNKPSWQPAIQRVKKPSNQEYKVSSTLTLKEEITLPEQITVKEFSEKMGVSIAELIKKFISNWMLLTLNSTIDYDTAALIAEDFWIKVLRENSTASLQDMLEGNLQAILEADKTSDNKETRPPIVTIMWHVDHGKTTLLDYIRKTQVTNQEAGWITQSIWASQVVYQWKKITFVDTPWHELFTSLRARWSKITDIVVIVVAADDWIMKQTVEAINHAKAANVPILIAITKIDRWTDNTEKIKQQLSEHSLICEDWWWDVPLLKVSWKTWQWVDTLLENILLYSDLANLVYNPSRAWVWVILEAHKDQSKWVMASIVMMTWALKIWDVIWAHGTFWKIKKMYDWKWKPTNQAEWWDPVLILWLQEVPEAWRLIEVVSSEKEARNRIEEVMLKEQKSNSAATLASAIQMKIQSWDHTQLNLIIKADSWGSLEAVKYSIASLELPENVDIKLVHTDVWNFTQSDIDLAKVANALLIGFNSEIQSSLKKKIENEKLTLRIFNIIYELTDYIDWLVKWLIRIDPVEVSIGKLEVLWVFFRKWNDSIFWWKVIEWEVRNWSLFRIKKPDWEVIQWKITSLQKDQTNVDKMSVGHECGMKARISKKIDIWDILEYYVME